MLPNVYELQFVETRFHDLRREASDYRLAQTYRLSRDVRPTLIDRFLALASRVLLIRLTPNWAEAAA
jgi:hypothetical protein